MTFSYLALLALAAGYLLGSVPTGLWLGLRLRGVDIREAGSRNIGATNTMRVLGKKLGAAALAADIAKGLTAVLLIARLDPAQPHLPLFCGVAAILGHSFSIFLRFRGGKGVATSAGVFLGLAPGPMAIAIAVFAAVVAATRMVSAASVCAAAALAVSVWFFPLSTVIRVVVAVVAILVILKHRANIRRILRGEENKI
ncbi:MAG: glycerol-3-phosphate 1-O-acyltransferase PlsY [Candidatus Hydrogenedentes bacterium]|nr:glycerol-3-phosphate 1-O-acyltransferase PlsY [Candidatus Hydrogenedentota bacterium]